MNAILLVEDTRDIGESIKLYLESSGFAVTRVLTKQDCLTQLQTKQFDCIILDWMLPDGSGIELCQHIKSFCQVPIIMETAKYQVEDKLKGFDAGADDYLAKPFDLRELEARVVKLIQRYSANQEQDSIMWHDFVFDKERMTVHKHGEQIHMTANEWVILKLLLESPWEAVARTVIADYLRGDMGMRESDNKIDVLISWIRKKLAKEFIVTVKWFGYKLGI